MGRKITLENIDKKNGIWSEVKGGGKKEPDVKPKPAKKFDKAVFFKYVRANLFRGRLNQGQVEGLEYLLGWLDKAPFTEGVRVQQAAYCLATFQHETAHKMQPIKEYGGPRKRYAPWYGRGYVQLTWKANYLKQERKLKNMPLVMENNIPWAVHQHKELALNPETSAVISIWGMIAGDFTGKSILDYIRPSSIDYVNARRVVNGTDKAKTIAGMARKYEQALRLGGF